MLATTGTAVVKPLGGMRIGVGVVFGIIVAVWARAIGFYRHELPTVVVLRTIAFGGLFGEIVLFRNAPPGWPTATALAWRPPLEAAQAIEPRAQIDDNLSAEALAKPAADRPNLRDAIAAHPQASPGLRAWIAEASPGHAVLIAEADARGESGPEPASRASQVIEDEAWTVARKTVEDPGAALLDLALITQHYPELRGAVARKPAGPSRTLGTDHNSGAGSSWLSDTAGRAGATMISPQATVSLSPRVAA